MFRWRLTIYFKKSTLLPKVIMNCGRIITKLVRQSHKNSGIALFCSPSWCRHCFATFTNTSSIDIFLRNLYRVHNQIYFTKEVELHNFLAFVYVLIEKTDKGIKTTTYHKPIRTGHLTNFSRFFPLRYKQNLVNSLLHRSYSICNSYSQIDTEFCHHIHSFEE